MRYAFELARKEHKTLTSVSKGNALGYSMVFWDEIFEQVSRDFPDVPAKTILIDAACMMAVMRPEEFQVVVTSNLFGDIFSDIGAAIGGGMGMAAGANINPERKYPSMFEPVHGSAPDIAGQNKANPLATILSAAMMLRYSFSLTKEADAIEKAVEDTLRQGWRTADIYTEGCRLCGTVEMGDAVISNIK